MISRGKVKTPEAPPHAVVSQLFATEGYRSLTTAEGRELYCHRHRVGTSRLEHLAIGTEVHFAEEQGDKGPHTSTVAMVRNPGV